MGTVSSTAASPEATPHPYRRGLSEHAVRRLSYGAGALIAVLALGWVWAIANARDLAAARAESGDVPLLGRVGRALTSRDAPSTAYLTDAALVAVANHVLDNQRGASGKLRATIQPAPAPLPVDSLPQGGALQYRKGAEVAAAPMECREPGQRRQRPPPVGLAFRREQPARGRVVEDRAAIQRQRAVVVLRRRRGFAVARRVCESGP